MSDDSVFKKGKLRGQGQVRSGQVRSGQVRSGQVTHLKITGPRYVSPCLAPNPEHVPFVFFLFHR